MSGTSDPSALAARATDRDAVADELEIRGADVSLRYARLSDAAALFRLASDAEVTRFFSWGPYREPREAEDYVASLPAKRAQGRMLEFVIVHRDAGVIGVTGLSEFSLRDRRAVVGTWHGREWWGKGANRQSKSLILRLAFAGLGLERVTAWCGTDNGRSQTALERLGFVHEGILRHWHVHAGEPKDVISYGMLRSDWEATGLAREPCEIAGRLPPQFVIR